MEEKEIGKIAHYFGNISVGIVEITEGTLNVGDTIRIKGRTTDIEQKVESMQIEHDSVQGAKAGDVVGIKVSGHVREHDVVYKVT